MTKKGKNKMADEIKSTEIEDESEFMEPGTEADDDWDSVEWPTDDGADDSKGDSEADESHHDEDGDADVPDTGSKAEEQKTDSHHEYELTFNHETVKVGEEEVKRLAQKGLNYDKIVEERDSMKSSMARYQDMEAFLNEIKGDFGTIEELMDDTRAQLLMRDDPSKTLEAAKDAVRSKRSGSKAKAVDNSAVDAFIQKYPTVKAEDIPQSVWDEVRQTGDLVGAYGRYENTQLNAQIKALQDEIAILKQNNENESRSSGSRRSSGGSTAKTLAQQLWDDED